MSIFLHRPNVCLHLLIYIKQRWLHNFKGSQSFFFLNVLNYLSYEYIFYTILLYYCVTLWIISFHYLTIQFFFNKTVLLKYLKCQFYVCIANTHLLVLTNIYFKYTYVWSTNNPSIFGRWNSFNDSLVRKCFANRKDLHMLKWRRFLECASKPNVFSISLRNY